MISRVSVRFMFEVPRQSQITSSASNNFLSFGLGKFVAGAREHNIERGQKEDTHHQVGDESADNDDSKGALGIRADSVGKRGREKAESRHQHGHHDRSKT